MTGAHIWGPSDNVGLVPASSELFGIGTGFIHGRSWLSMTAGMRNVVSNSGSGSRQILGLKESVIKVLQPASASGAACGMLQASEDLRRGLKPNSRPKSERVENAATPSGRTTSLIVKFAPQRAWTSRCLCNHSPIWPPF